MGTLGRTRCALAAAVVAIGIGWGAARVGAQTTIALSSYERFEIEYRGPGGGTRLFTEQDARLKYYVGAGPVLVTVWHVTLGAGYEVIIGAFNDVPSLAHFMGFVHLGGVPPGWQVVRLRQYFDIAFAGNPRVGDLRFVAPIVYGPTHYDASVAQSVIGAYPTFLQAQFVAIEDVVNGGALALAADDDLGRPKRIGFVSGGATNQLSFVAEYVPQRGERNPLPPLWLPGYSMRFGYRKADLADAIAWYRTEQSRRPSSFLSRRQAVGQHPDLANAMFAVGVGAVTSTLQRPSGQYDLTRPYRNDVLSYFRGLHGPGMQLYHLGWWEAVPTVADVYPDAFGAITPGHRALINAGVRVGTRSVGYTLPGVLSTLSIYAGAAPPRLDEDGSIATVVLPDFPNHVYHGLTYYPSTTTTIYGGVYDRMVTQLGFDGAYLDALSPWPQSFSYFRDAHPPGRNAEWLGIERLLADIRGRFVGRGPVLFCETPTDCVHTDASAIDLNNWDPDYWNVFAMIYDGVEWPRYSVVYGWSVAQNAPSGTEYAREFANCLAGGAKPVILWPEDVGVFPTDPRSDPEFAPLVSMLRDYVQNYASFWRGIIEGRVLQPLDPAQIVAPYIPQPSALANRDPVTDRWRLPGYRPRVGGSGCVPPDRRVTGSSAVFTGLVEPAGRPGTRCLVLYRWTDPTMAHREARPAGHPLHDATVTVRLRLSARRLQASPGARIRLIDVSTRSVQELGHLPSEPGALTPPIDVVFSAPGAKAIVID